MTISALALAAKKVIDAAWLHGDAYDLASQAAFALESAQLLQSPETAAELVRLRAEVVALREERHSTNEALSDAAVALREQQDRFETLRALCDAADSVGIVSGGWFTVEAVRRAAAGEPLPKPDGITRRIAPTQALREAEDDVRPQVTKLQALLAGQRAAVEGEHYPTVHHDYRVPRDLPEAGDR